MKSLLKSLVQGVAGVLVGAFIVAAAQLPFPAVNGPYLGDGNNNLYQITQAYVSGSGHGTGTGISASQTSGQTNCTATGLVNMIHSITTSASTGYICLPTAYSGRQVVYYNSTTQTIDVYGSNTPFAGAGGTNDTINGTTGSTAYTGLTTLKTMICHAYANGAWSCGSIS